MGAVSPARAGIVAALGPARFAPLSNVPAASFAFALRLAGCAAVFTLVRELSWRLRSRTWAAAVPLLAVAALEAALGLVQCYSSGSEVARGTYINRNHYAGLLEFSLPFAVMGAVWVLRRGRARHSSPAVPALLACLLLAASALLLIAILASLSRMGFLAALAALLVMGVLSLGGIQSRWRRWTPGAAIVLLVASAFVLLPSDALIARFADLAAGEEISANDRAVLWHDTLGLIRAYPILGCGFGAYESSFARFKTVAPMQTADFAHNDYLQVLAEAGLLGFALAAALAIRSFAAAFRAAAAPPRTLERYLGLACAGSFTAVALHSLVDFNLYIPANGMLVAWIAGLAASLKFLRPPRIEWDEVIPAHNSLKLAEMSVDGISAPARRCALGHHRLRC